MSSPGETRLPPAHWEIESTGFSDAPVCVAGVATSLSAFCEVTFRKNKSPGWLSTYVGLHFVC